MSRDKEVSIIQSKGAFSIFRRQNAAKEDFSDIASLRQVLSNEKAKILYAIKTQKPVSIYDLAKKLGRSFKAVSDDVKLLKKFGVINLAEENTKGRKRLKPELATNSITVHFRI